MWVVVSVFTIVTGVDPFSQQEAAELVFGMDGVLDLHQVGRHAERIILQVAPALLTATGNETTPRHQPVCVSSRRSMGSHGGATALLFLGRLVRQRALLFIGIDDFMYLINSPF